MSQTEKAKAEKIKTSISGIADKSKETIREIVATNLKYIDEALESNKIVVNSIKEKLSDKEIDDTFTDTMKTSFGKSVELAEDALDSIINSYTRQMEMSSDFNTRLIDAIKESQSSNPEKLMNLIFENFEAARQLTIDNTKEILGYYNKHTNLAVDFNNKFGENVQSQIGSFQNLQTKSLTKFTNMAVEWNKQ